MATTIAVLKNNFLIAIKPLYRIRDLDIKNWQEGGLKYERYSLISYPGYPRKILILGSLIGDWGRRLVNRITSMVVIIIVILAGVGGAILLAQNGVEPKPGEQILKVKAFDMLLPISALGSGFNNHSWIVDGWGALPGYYVPYQQQSIPRPNNAAYLHAESSGYLTGQPYYKFQNWIVVFNTIEESSDYYTAVLPGGNYLNYTINLNSIDEGWYTPNSIDPNTTWQYSALRIKNVIALLNVDSEWMTTYPSPLPEGWFKDLVDFQINMINSTAPDPMWSSSKPSTLMLGYDDLNDSDPNAWSLSYYSGTNVKVDERKSYYFESYSKYGESSQTILRFELAEYNTTQGAIEAFTYYTGFDGTTETSLGIGDESCLRSSYGIAGDVTVRKGVYLFIIFWGFNEQGTASTNETQLAIDLATLQVSRLP